MVTGTGSFQYPLMFFRLKLLQLQVIHSLTVIYLLYICAQLLWVGIFLGLTIIFSDFHLQVLLILTANQDSWIPFIILFIQTEEYV